MKRAVPRPAASRHAVILLVIAVALYAVARGSGAGWPIVVLAGLLAVLAVATVWPAAALARLTLSAAAPRDGTAGRPVAIELEVGGGRQPLKIRLVDPPGPSVWAEPPAAGRLTGVPARRGVVGTLRLEARCAGPLGLVWWRRPFAISLERPLEVGPAPIETALPATLLSGSTAGEGSAGAARGTTVVRSVREYVPGDAARLVHWPATARRGTLTVKELEAPAGPVLAIVADLRGDADSSEAAAGRAAGLALVALRAGVEVILLTAEAGGARVAAVSDALDVGRRLARAVAAAPPEGPLDPGTTVVRVTVT